MTAVVAARRSRAATRAAVLTLIWVLAVPLLLLLGFMAQFSMGDGQNPNERYGPPLFLLAAAIGVGLPLTVGVIAIRARRPVLAVVYLVLTVALLVPAGGLVLAATDSLRSYQPAPAPGEQRPAGGCQEHSGSDTRCPGG